MKSKVFITGASGYIGGSILIGLLRTPEKYEISALIRKEEQGKILEKIGVIPIYGDLNDSETLYKQANGSDIVINAASADHLSSVKSIVNGLKDKKSKECIFIHTSGTGVLAYESVTNVPFDDENIERIHSIPLKAPHKNVDSWIFENTTEITMAIIAPSTINGIGIGPFKKTSQQVINLIKASIKRNHVGYLSDRKDVTWGNVNINDLVDLYLLVLDGLINKNIDEGKKGGWYFGIACDHTWYKIYELLAQILFKRKLIKDTNITKFEQNYINDFFGGNDNIFGFICDSKGIANRSKKIGWRPNKPNVYETLEEEISYLINSGEINSKVNF
jgi:putative NADH-flavin reductase